MIEYGLKIYLHGTHCGGLAEDFLECHHGVVILETALEVSLPSS